MKKNNISCRMNTQILGKAIHSIKKIRRKQMFHFFIMSDMTSFLFITLVLVLIYHCILDNHCNTRLIGLKGQNSCCNFVAMKPEKLNTYISNTVFSCSSFALLSSISESLFCPSSTRSCLAISSTS